MKLEKINIFLLALFISWGPIFWFPYIGKILAIKFALLVLIICLNIRALCKVNLVAIANILLVFLLFVYVLYDYADSFSDHFINVYLNIICAFVFYMIGKGNGNIKAILIISCDLICIYCVVLLFFLAFNIIEFFPIEYTKELSNGTIELIPLYSTGWGFGRTEWSTTLSIFVPAHYIAFDHEKKKWRLYLGVVLLFITILLSQSRGGLIAAFISFSFLSFYISKNKPQSMFLFGVLLGAAIISAIIFKEELRLGSETLARDERNEQWEILLPALRDLPFRGYGFYGNIESMYQFGIDNMFHDSFLRCLFGFGIAGAYIDCIILFILLKAFLLAKKGKTITTFSYMCVLFCGFICTFTEPSPIVVSFYWPLWWFLAGYLSIPLDFIDQNEIMANNDTVATASSNSMHCVT